MAEAIFRDLASKRLGCPVEKLRELDLDVFSAGVAAADNMPASPEAISILHETGIDLSAHLSQQVTVPMLEQSDLILAMTPGHLAALKGARPDLASRMRTLRTDGQGISDPIGCGMTEYRRCAEEITGCLEDLLNHYLKKDTETT
jgi:protein-tyrosine-phosphatase